MGPSRYIPRLIRRRYFAALDDLPRFEPSNARAAPGSLVPVDTRTVDERLIRFHVVAGRPRLRLSFVDVEPAELGSVIGLDDRPELVISEQRHLEWASEAGRARSIRALAVQVWSSVERNCEG
ncbi:hypothetical protein GCM10027447_04090 [Glycomyces halotolerans]